jgi:hypothetical protein
MFIQFNLPFPTYYEVQVRFHDNQGTPSSYNCYSYNLVKLFMTFQKSHKYRLLFLCFLSLPYLVQLFMHLKILIDAHYFFSVTATIWLDCSWHLRNLINLDYFFHYFLSLPILFSVIDLLPSVSLRMYIIFSLLQLQFS